MIILAFSVLQLWKIKQSTQDTTNLYSSLAEQVQLGTSAISTEIQYIGTTSQQLTSNIDDVMAGYKEPIINPWITELQQQNNELIGWIKIPNTMIDYPVMQTKDDNDYYLYHDFERNQDNHGTPFIDVNCKIGQSDNIIIYGHHMKDGTMFQNLMFYKDAQFCEKNEYIQLYTPEKSLYFQVMYVILISAEETKDFPYYKYIDFSSEKVFQEFLNKCNQYAIWSSNQPPNYGEQLLTLSTCEYSKENGRMAVIGRCIN